MTRLYDYWRSSASYRVRMALNLCGAGFEIVPVDLLQAEQVGAANLARNPQGLVPTVEIDGLTLTQSLAIIENLAEEPVTAADPQIVTQGRDVVRTVVLWPSQPHPVWWGSCDLTCLMAHAFTGTREC